MGVWESYVIEAGLSGLLSRVGGQSTGRSEGRFGLLLERFG